AGARSPPGRPCADPTAGWVGLLPTSPRRTAYHMELGLDVEEKGGTTVLAVKGEVDVYTAPRLREKLVELVSQGKYKIVVNLEGVDFLDSTGLGVLVGGLKRLRSHD